MTEQECLFSNLQVIADSIVAQFGKNCEACVHDLTNLDKSLIHISGTVTKRKPGAPATDVLLKMLKKGRVEEGEVFSYITTTGDGRSLKSTTSLIRDSKNKPVAAFCINFDTTDFYNASQAMATFAQIQDNSPTLSSETFAHSVSETVEALFNQAVKEIGRHPVTMKVDEKTELVSLLEDVGVFQFKGSVEQVAHLMGVTKFTVYNYLKKVHSGNLGDNASS